MRQPASEAPARGRSAALGCHARLVAAVLGSLAATSLAAFAQPVVVQASCVADLSGSQPLASLLSCAQPIAQAGAGDIGFGGDADWGEYLAAECLVCHRMGAKDAAIPEIARMPEPEFLVAMYAYRAKLRADPGMQLLAGRLSDDEILALAAYFAQLPP
jgi:cytochrome c553